MREGSEAGAAGGLVADQGAAVALHGRHAAAAACRLATAATAVPSRVGAGAGREKGCARGLGRLRLVG